MTKSVTNALVGILVRDGRLDLQGPAPVPAWRDVSDPRHAITVEELLRQTSGLDVQQDNSGFDRTSRVMYTFDDKAAAGASAALIAAPGRRWTYSDLHYMLLARIVRDAVGGNADDAARFIRDELFTPFFTTKREGRGLGLTIVQEILANHHLPFSLQNRAGGGAEFRIQFRG